MGALPRSIVGLALSGLCIARPADADAQTLQPVTVTAPLVTLRAARREATVLLDGRLDDAAWQAAPVARDFTQSWPNPGKPPVDPMEVRVLYDAEAIYVGVRMFDAHPDSIAAQLARRDASGIYSDWVHVIIDSYHDRRTAFRFTTNPRGVQKDVYNSNDNNEDVNWDAVWEVATRIDSLGWVAEYRIPLSQLRFGNAPAGVEQVWGFQVMRDVARRNERTSWSPWVPDGGGFVARFGDLTGLVDLPQPRRLEVMPYASTKATRAPGNSANPFYRRMVTEPSVGADVRYGLPAGLTLTATVNPDFGQVEVDPAVVNLTAFEVFFPERRPFFLEGSDVFSFGQVRRNNDYGSQTFFYTRRVGRAPSRVPSGPGIAFVDMPAQTRIAGAAKVTGKIGPWTVGLLDAVTSEERADVAGAAGTIDSSTAVEPRANYFAGRLRRDFRNGQSVVGGMITMIDRRQSPLFTNLLSGRAGFGGVDFEHRWAKGKYILSGFSAESRVSASAPVIAAIQRSSAHNFQRPDARTLIYDPTRTSLSGRYNEVAIAKTGTWFGSVAIKDVSPGFEINDVGFQSRVDYRAVSPFFGYQTNQADSWSRDKSASMWSNHTWNSDAKSLYQGVGGQANATFTNFWSAGVNFSAQARAFNDRLLRGGPLAYMPATQSINLWFNTDTRRAVWLNPSVNFSRSSGDASWSGRAGLYIEARPTTSVHVAVGPSYSKQLSTSQYVRAVADATAGDTYGARYVFADLTQTTASMETRVNWTLSPRLSFQSFFQPFVSVGHFQAFKEFTRPGGFDFAVYGRDRGVLTPSTNGQGGVTGYSVDPDGAGPAAAFSITNPDFNTHSLRGNAVLRWEYRPGSALYFVWQQERSGAESAFQFDARRDVGAIFRERPTNVFLIKAAYWLSR